MGWIYCCMHGSEALKRQTHQHDCSKASHLQGKRCCVGRCIAEHVSWRWICIVSAKSQKTCQSVEANGLVSDTCLYHMLRLAYQNSKDVLVVLVRTIHTTARHRNECTCWTANSPKQKLNDVFMTLLSSLHHSSWHQHQCKGYIAVYARLIQQKSYSLMSLHQHTLTISLSSHNAYLAVTTTRNWRIQIKRVAQRIQLPAECILLNQPHSNCLHDMLMHYSLQRKRFPV